MQAKDYRPDIDVLRAIAVLSVVFYHAHIPFFTGGYVGVDIFFVISGFLITGIIKRKLANNSFSFLEFYENRVRRILPALFVMFIITFLFFSCFAAYDMEILLIRRSIKRALFAISNFHFYMNTGYFDQAAEYMPMLHTWSLAVEEQFYFIVPACLFLLYKISKQKERAIYIYILLVAMVSFIASSILVYYNQKFTFYMLPTRAWELLVGSFLAYTEWTPKTQKSKCLCFFIGIALLVYSILFFENKVFPGFWAIFPCIGSFLYIAGGTNLQSSFVKLFTENKILVFIGVVSYSFYLWHWPIFVFFFSIIIKPTIFFSFILILLSLGVAILSWKFVERPVRLNPLFKKRKILWITTVISFIIVFTLTDTISKPLVNLNNYSYSMYQMYKDFQLGLPEKHSSFLYDNTVLLVGDSHAASEYELLNNIANNNSINLSFYWDRLDKQVASKYETDNFDKNVIKIKEFCKKHSVDSIIFIYRMPWYTGYTNNFGDIQDYKIKMKSKQLSMENEVYSELESNILLAKENGIKNIFIQLPLPEPYKDIPNTSNKLDMFLKKSEKEINDLLGESIENYNKRIQLTMEILIKLQQKYPEIHFVNPVSYFLNETKNKYIVTKDKKSLYIDDDHLSIEGSTLITPLYKELFNDIKNNTIKKYYGYSN